MTVTSSNPATDELLSTYPTHSAEELELIVGAARCASSSLRSMSLKDRCQLLVATAAELRARRDELALLITREMGKPVREARAEIEKSATACEYYADAAETLLAPRPIAHELFETWIEFEPLGPILAVMPWNYPIWQVVRAAAPAMVVGNTIVLKHATNVTGSALLLEEIVRSAGWPEGSLIVAITDSQGVETLLANPGIRGVTLTGGTGAGSAVAGLAGANLKKSVLELGGSDAFIVLDDADIDAAVEAAVSARFLNAGQSCIAAKRFLVADAIALEFEEKFAAAVSQLVVGDPENDLTDIGPMARQNIRDELIELARTSVDAGATLVHGSLEPEGGAFLVPMVLTRVTAEMPVFTSETFGPVAAIVRFESDEDAADLANDSAYGLSLAIWSRDDRRALELSRKIESGMAFINSFTASDPRMPFGGVKGSGYGRELGELGITEFANARTFAVRATDEARR